MLAYALGGGLGHVTRVRALAAVLGSAGPLTILTSNPDAADPRMLGDAEVVLAPKDVARDPKGLEAFVRATTEQRDPDEVLVDAFPRGILGELRSDTFGGRPLRHAARALRWEAYGPVATSLAAGSSEGPAGGPRDGDDVDVDGLRFHVTYVVEPIGDAQRAFLASCSDAVVAHEVRDLVEPPRLGDGTIVTDLRAAVRAGGDAPRSGRLRPGEEAPRRDGDVLEAAAAPLWLVVHSGPDEETLELARYAADIAAGSAAGTAGTAAGGAAPSGTGGTRPQLVVISRRRPAALDPAIAHLDVRPAWPLFDQAAHVFAGAGSNVVRQLAPHRERTSLLPFDRRYDDQYARAIRFRADG